MFEESQTQLPLDVTPPESTAALVLVDGASDLEFDYLVPDHLKDKIALGTRVNVPLKDRVVTGTVLSVHPAAAASVRRLRPITSFIDGRPVLTPKLLELGRWIADYYCASLENVMRAMLPESVRTDRHNEKRVFMVRLLRMPDDAERPVMEKKARKQLEILDALLEAGEPVAMSQFPAAAVKALAKKLYVAVEDEQVLRDPHSTDEFLSSGPLEMNEEQKVALEAILEAVAAPAEAKPILLHGITGSGKTEVYLQATQQVLDRGGSVLVLVPEISLTPQTVDRFKSRFAHMQKHVAVLHSAMSQGERFDEWHKVQRGSARIVIGARSAIFAPLDDLGLIIVDEEHENSYKQENPPRYHARDVAVVRAVKEPCAIVLGSATPSLESWHNAQTGKYRLLTMKERADSARLPLIRVIDMKLEKGRTKGAPAILSEKLRIAMDIRLTRGEQVILFLNRRGWSSSVQCQACGEAVKCNHCSIPMTLHKDVNKLVCHVCGFQRLAPRKCPNCSDPGILFAGFGTERVEETLRKAFPQAKIARVDTDAMQQRHKLRDTLAAFKAKKIDILIGTQMIAKGLHFPDVTLVGVLNADLTLHIPDFRAGERTFGLLTQVAGRAGRGELLGEVIVQTFTPHHPAVQHARHHDFLGYAEQDLDFRRQCGFPPYGHAVLLTIRSERQNLAEFAIADVHKRLQRSLPEGVLMGDPVPSPLERSHNQWRFQLLLRARQARPITRALQAALHDAKLGKEVFCVIDVDPLSLG